MIRGHQIMHEVTAADWRSELRLLRLADPARAVLLLEGAYDKWFWQPFLAERTIALSLNNRNQVLRLLPQLTGMMAERTIAVVDADQEWLLPEIYVSAGIPVSSTEPPGPVPLLRYPGFNLESWLLSSPASQRLLEQVQLQTGGLSYRTPAMSALREMGAVEAAQFLWRWSRIIGAYRAAAWKRRWSFRFRLLNVGALLMADGETIDHELLCRTLISSSGKKTLRWLEIYEEASVIEKRTVPDVEAANGHDWINALVNVFLKTVWQPGGPLWPSDGRHPGAWRNPGADQTWAETLLRQSVPADWLESSAFVQEIRNRERQTGTHFIRRLDAGDA